MQTLSGEAEVATRSRWRTLVALFCGLVLLGGLQGCSALRFAYGQGPELLAWWADGYLGLSDSQKEDAISAAQRWQTWQRHALLPEVAESLEQAGRELPQALSSERACMWVDQWRAQADRALSQAVPEASRLAVTLAPAQLQRLAVKQEESNQSFKDEVISVGPEQRQRDAARRWTGNLARVWGELNTRQMAAVAVAAREHSPDPLQADAARRARQRDVLATLRLLPGGNAAEAESALRALQARLFSPPQPALAAFARQQQEVQCALWAEAHRLSTPDQRSRAAARLQAWAQDLRELSARR